MSSAPSSPATAGLRGRSVSAKWEFEPIVTIAENWIISNGIHATEINSKQLSLFTSFHVGIALVTQLVQALHRTAISLQIH